VTPVVSHVFLQIVARELGTRVPKNVPFCACPTFDRCVGVGAGGGVAQESGHTAANWIVAIFQLMG